MKKTIKRTVLTAMVLALPASVYAAGGLKGDCVDCHTMHNSEQGQPVAMVDGETEPNAGGIYNLLRYDCLACHARGAGALKIDGLASGDSKAPQVYHDDPSGDLAGGNFAYIDGLKDPSTADGPSQRHGHNVSGLFDITPDNADTNGSPPGKYRPTTHGAVFTTSTAFDNFGCAGAAGCHGTRSQLLSGDTETNYDGNNNNRFVGTKRTGIAAISGSHHNNQDGAKTIGNYPTNMEHNAIVVYNSYRFIPGLKGYENEPPAEGQRWQNIDANEHNEYYGQAIKAGQSCSDCHQEGDDETLGGYGSRMTFDSVLKVPNNSMSGFCATCHGMFHSGNGENGTGKSGAFLRHPSDYVIPTTGEYGKYTNYDITAPVSRPTVYTAASATVAPGTDMVMCLSCHKAHGSEYEYMLRFDYTDSTSAMTAGIYADSAGAQAEGGCMACHSLKGVLPGDRVGADAPPTTLP